MFPSISRDQGLRSTGTQSNTRSDRDKTLSTTRFLRWPDSWLRRLQWRDFQHLRNRSR